MDWLAGSVRNHHSRAPRDVRQPLVVSRPGEAARSRDPAQQVAVPIGARRFRWFARPRDGFRPETTTPSSRVPAGALGDRPNGRAIQDPGHRATPGRRCPRSRSGANGRQPVRRSGTTRAAPSRCDRSSSSQPSFRPSHWRRSRGLIRRRCGRRSPGASRRATRKRRGPRFGARPRVRRLRRPRSRTGRHDRSYNAIVPFSPVATPRRPMLPDWSRTVPLVAVAARTAMSTRATSGTAAIRIAWVIVRQLPNRVLTDDARRPDLIGGDVGRPLSRKDNTPAGKNGAGAGRVNAWLRTALALAEARGRAVFSNECRR